MIDKGPVNWKIFLRPGGWRVIGALVRQILSESIFLRVALTQQLGSQDRGHFLGYLSYS